MVEGPTGRGLAYRYGCSEAVGGLRGPGEVGVAEDGTLPSSEVEVVARGWCDRRRVRLDDRPDRLGRPRGGDVPRSADQLELRQRHAEDGSDLAPPVRLGPSRRAG